MNRFQIPGPHFTAIIFKDGKWWTGFVEEVPGAVSQAETKEELVHNLQAVLKEVLEILREEAVKQVKGKESEEIKGLNCYEEIALA